MQYTFSRPFSYSLFLESIRVWKKGVKEIKSTWQFQCYLFRTLCSPEKRIRERSREGVLHLSIVLWENCQHKICQKLQSGENYWWPQQPYYHLHHWKRSWGRKRKFKLRVITFFPCVVNIIWRQRACVSWEENGFKLEIKIFALLEAMGGSNMKWNQGSYILKTTL